MGNIVNRVFDSSGPEGKVRGTPQQIIEKYLVLARDAQLGNDRVSAENFLQHAEHYTRMLGEAQREMAREQENRREQQQQQQQNQQQQATGPDDGSQQPQGRSQDRDRRDQRNKGGDAADAAAPVIDLAEDDKGASTLVETPEQDGPARQPGLAFRTEESPTTPPGDAAKPAPRTRSPRKPRKPAAEGDAPRSKGTARKKADSASSQDDNGQARNSAAE
jgi:hypothetical protein